MRFEAVPVVPDDVELVIEGVTSDEPSGGDAATLAGFEAKTGQTMLLPGRLLVGLGPAGGVTPAVVRRAAGAASRAAARAQRVAVLAPPFANGDSYQPLAEGMALGAYRFTAYRSDPKPNRIAEVAVVGAGDPDAQAALDRGGRLAAATALARDLANEPGGLLTPSALADRAVEMAGSAGLGCEVLDEHAMAAANLNGTLAVNRGSVHPPRFVILTYEPEGEATGSVALVGKGVTFDSGGLSLKTAEGMIGMQGDMGGAAAVLGAMSVLRDLGVTARVRAFIPITDNMTGGDATRVGDVVRYRNGRTVEVLNTDAEGRLILADALVLASEESPDAIVDLATLTGACMVALGRRVAGLFSPDDVLASALAAAGERAGEPLWRLPVVDGYRKELDSKVADLKNVGAGRIGGAITATLFLREFVGDGIPWAHLDIAGPAWLDEEDGEWCVNGTGFGVRTLAAWLSLLGAGVDGP
ncbi:MAG: leucyl aminopeptidase [Acidimicrobiia bacterium]